MNNLLLLYNIAQNLKFRSLLMLLFRTGLDIPGELEEGCTVLGFPEFVSERVADAKRLPTASSPANRLPTAEDPRNGLAPETCISHPMDCHA